MFIIIFLNKNMTGYNALNLLSKTVNLFTLESIIKQGLLSPLKSTTKPTILTTVLHNTHSIYQEELQKLSENNFIKIVPYFYPLIDIHNSQGSVQFSDPNNTRKISLLIGENNPELIKHLDSARIITLEQVCRAFPQKVPLSQRDKNSSNHREILEKRLGMKMSREKVIQFQHILVLNPLVQMWDQAFQVILDCQPTPIYVPYLKNITQNEGLYRLTLSDFISGLRKIHQTVSSAVTTHPPLNIVEIDQKKQLNWLISNVASSASEMTIDLNFFTEKPKVQACGGPVKIIQSLESAI